jgi:hypothetical protein
MARKILIVLAILGVFLAVAAVVVGMQPDTFSVQRSVTIAASPAAVFDQVNDFQAWDGWSPWKELDPNAKKTLSTPSAGKGATFGWSGNDKVGEGSLTILESRPGEMVDIEQVFVRPLAGKARMVFTFAPEVGGTKVTWTMDGTNNFLGKAMCMIVDMDAMLGKDFDRGLANMKTVAEKGGAAQAATAP